MKKLAVTLAVVLGLGFTQVNAQTISGGVKAEANMSNFILSDLDHMNSNMGFGASLGGFMKIEFNENFALQPELLFHLKNSEVEQTLLNLKSTNDYQYWGAEIPIYAVGQMSLGNGKGYIGIGPYVGLGFSAKYKFDSDNIDDIDLYEEDNLLGDKSIMKRFDFGAGVMLGYQFNNGIQINASYKIGILNMMDFGSDDAAMRNQTISLGVGYKF